MSTHRPRLLWAISHPTLVRAEVPILRAAGFDVVAEEPDPSVLRELDVVNYPRTVGAGDVGATGVGPQLRLWARDGLVTPAEAAVINASFDAIMVATRLDLAINVRRWFSGAVLFRYFGNVPAVPHAATLPVDHRVLAGITGVPIFTTLLETELCQGLDHNVVMRTVVPSPSVPDDVVVGGGDDVCLYLGGMTDVAAMREWVCSIAVAIPNRTVTVMGLAEEHRAAFSEVAENVRCLPRLGDEDYWRTFAAARVMVYPHRDRHHSHYVPLEAMALGVPCLVVADGMAAHEARGYDRELGEGAGVFADASAIAAALPTLADSNSQLVSIVEAQHKLLAPFTEAAVIEQAIVLRDRVELVALDRPTVAEPVEAPATVPSGQPVHTWWSDPTLEPLTVAVAGVAASEVLSHGWSARLRVDASGALGALESLPGPDLLLKLGGPDNSATADRCVEVSLTVVGNQRPNATVEVTEGDETVSTWGMPRAYRSSGRVRMASWPLVVRPGQGLRVRVRTALSAERITLSSVGLQVAVQPAQGVGEPHRLWQIGRANVTSVPGTSSLSVRTLRAKVDAGTTIGATLLRHAASAHAVVFSRPPGGGTARLESLLVMGRIVPLRRRSLQEREVLVAGTATGVERLTFNTASDGSP